jgi:hypothetical protein
LAWREQCRRLHRRGSRIEKIQTNKTEQTILRGWGLLLVKYYTGLVERNSNIHVKF